MPLRWCEVTRVLPDGRRHTLKLEAKSIYHAAVLYYGSTVIAPSEASAARFRNRPGSPAAFSSAAPGRYELGKSGSGKTV